MNVGGIPGDHVEGLETDGVIEFDGASNEFLGFAGGPPFLGLNTSRRQDQKCRDQPPQGPWPHAGPSRRHGSLAAETTDSSASISVLTAATE